MIRRGIKIIIKCREWRKRCNECNAKITWKSKNECEDCEKVNRSCLNVHCDDATQEINKRNEIRSNDERKDEGVKRRVDSIKVKVALEVGKEEGVV